MKKTVVLLTLSLLIASLTACGSKDTPVATGNTSSSEVAEVAEVEEIEEDSEEPAEEADLTEEESDYPVGDPSNPMAVDPTPFWHGDDFFDIRAYFEACGASDTTWRMDEYDGGFIIHAAYGRFCGNREIRVYGENEKKYTGNIIIVEFEYDDAIDDVFMYDESLSQMMNPVWVDSERTLRIDREVLNNVFVMIESGSFFYDECPFRGTGVNHTKVDGSGPSNPGPHDD